MSEKKIYTLLQVTRSIQKTLADRYASSFWVKAEMNKLNFHKQSGHCYPELVEKSDGKIIAQLRSVMWNEAYLRCDKKFQSVLKESLRDGIKILFLAKITFDPVYGLSLIITDIDPSYTLGDLEREKQETIQRLIEEGIIDQNKNLSLPLLPQRIAVISVESSKGYADFEKVISRNPWGYKFFTMLFPSLLQGDRSVETIITQLNRIRRVASHFDAVAIIRGGGGDVGLSSYNDFRLASEVAKFPLPVLTGIGHATNETVVEMIANYNAITPTKLADTLIQYFHDFSYPVRDAERKIHDKGLSMLAAEHSRFASEVKLFRSVSENMLLTNEHELTNLRNSLSRESVSIFESDNHELLSLMQALEKEATKIPVEASEQLQRLAADLRKSERSLIDFHEFQVIAAQTRLAIHGRQVIKEQRVDLSHAEKNIDNMSPRNVLKRGYSITLHNGHAVKSVTDVKVGDSVKIEVADGAVGSIVEKIYERGDE